MSTTPCKVVIDAKLYAQVKEKAKLGRPKRTIKSIVEEAFTRFIAGEEAPAAPPPPPASGDVVLRMLAEHEAEARSNMASAERANDPQRVKTMRTEIALIQGLRQAHAAAAAREDAA